MLADILLLLLLAVVLWIAYRVSGQSKTADGFARLEARLDEYIRRMDGLEQGLGHFKSEQQEASAQLREQLIARFSELREQLRSILSEQGVLAEKRQGEAITQLAEGMQTGMTNIQKQVGEHLSRYSDELGKRMDGLTKQTDGRLQEISAQVEKRLSEGFEKTTATFADIVKRLALIDEAQKKITELSSNVVSLQEVLADKRSRGAFGEVQLNALIRNVLPEDGYQIQHKLPNNTMADCILFLPEPTGNVVIDSKFPLESYKRMTDMHMAEAERKAAERQFKQDIQGHIKDIAEKYIIPGVTSDGAVMFIPAEAVFAEIQAHHSDLVDKAHAARVWMVSPTTLWAILNTARAVLKDAATREQIHIIQKHLGQLAKDFNLFQGRMDKLSQHIRQAHNDVEQVNTSARKISARFEKIEKVELGNDDTASLPAIPADGQDENP